MILASCLEEGRDIIVIGIDDNLILLFFAAFLIGRTIEDDGSLRRSTGVLGVWQIKSCSDDGNDDRFAKRFVDRDTVDDIDIIAGSFFNEIDSDGRIL